MIDLETLLELGKEYGFWFVILIFYIWNQRKDAEFYQGTIDENFNKIETSIDALQTQNVLLLTSIINYNKGNTAEAKEILKLIIQSGNSKERFCKDGSGD